MNLSKFFDCISHGLFKAKLHVYGFTLTFVHSYLEVAIWKAISRILILAICGVFSTNFIWGASGFNLENPLDIVEKEAEQAMGCVNSNLMIANPDRFQSIALSKTES